MTWVTLVMADGVKRPVTSLASQSQCYIFIPCKQKSLMSQQKNEISLLAEYLFYDYIILQKEIENTITIISIVI